MERKTRDDQKARFENAVTESARLESSENFSHMQYDSGIFSTSGLKIKVMGQGQGLGLKSG